MRGNFLFSLILAFLMCCDPANPPDIDPTTTPDPPNPCWKNTCGIFDSSLSVFCGYWPQACNNYEISKRETLFGGYYAKFTTCGLTRMLTWRSDKEVVEAYYDSTGVLIGGGYFSNLVTDCGVSGVNEFRFRQFYGSRPSCCPTPTGQPAYPMTPQDMVSHDMGDPSNPP